MTHNSELTTSHDFAFHNSRLHFPPREQGLAIEPHSPKVDVRNAARVADVVDRIRVEHQKIGALAGSECAQIRQARR